MLNLSNIQKKVGIILMCLWFAVEAINAQKISIESAYALGGDAFLYGNTLNAQCVLEFGESNFKMGAGIGIGKNFANMHSGGKFIDYPNVVRFFGRGHYDFKTNQNTPYLISDIGISYNYLDNVTDRLLIFGVEGGYLFRFENFSFSCGAGFEWMNAIYMPMKLRVSF